MLFQDFSTRKNKGFTLVELLVVIGIIALLSSFAILQFTRKRQESKIAKAEADLDMIYKAATMLVTTTDEWPGHQEAGIVCTDLPGGCPADNEFCDTSCNGGCQACTNNLSSEEAGLTDDDSGNGYPHWDGPYISKIPNDPWGEKYWFDTDYWYEGGDTDRWVVAIGSKGPNKKACLHQEEDNGNNDDNVVKILQY